MTYWNLIIINSIMIIINLLRRWWWVLSKRRIFINADLKRSRLSSAIIIIIFLYKTIIIIIKHSSDWHCLDLLSPDLQTMQSVEGSSLLTNEPIISSTFHAMCYGHVSCGWIIWRRRGNWRQWLFSYLVHPLLRDSLTALWTLPIGTASLQINHLVSERE